MNTMVVNLYYLPIHYKHYIVQITCFFFSKCLYLPQEYDIQERMMHEFSLRGIYRDKAPLKRAPFYTKDWWLTQR